MSSRTRSDFGPLGGRRDHPHDTAGRHVEVKVDESWQPGVLARWEQAGVGWLGLVAWVTADGHLEVDLLPADRLRPIPPPPHRQLGA